jgi:four helix bundle protein
MATIRHLEELECWREARELVREIYRLSSQRKFERDYEMRNQTRRAVISVMSNIAEGYERGGRNEFIHFLSIAQGLAGELKSLLYVGLDLDYVTEEEFIACRNRISRINRMISSLTKYLRNSNVRGIKFRIAGSTGPPTANRKPQTGQP